MTNQTLDNDMGKVKGVITAIMKKDGETNGRKWTRYAIVIGGSEYSGFKGSIAGIEDLEEDQEVEITYKKNGNFKNIVEIDNGKVKKVIDSLSEETKAKIKKVEEMMEKTGKTANEFNEDEVKEVGSLVK